MTKFPKLSVPPTEITDPGTLRYGDGFITAEFPSRHIEKAYKAWRATVPNPPPALAALFIVSRRPSPLAVNEKLRKAGTGRWERTAAHKEANRQGALKRWAKVKSAKPLTTDLVLATPMTWKTRWSTPREAILDVLRTKGPMSKAEIIERAGLTPGRKSVPHFSGLLRSKTIRRVGDKVALAKVR